MHRGAVSRSAERGERARSDARDTCLAGTPDQIREQLGEKGPPPRPCSLTARDRSFVDYPCHSRTGAEVPGHHGRSPFSQEKLHYQSKTQTVIYRSKMHPVLKRNFEIFPALDWLAALAAHIPNQGEHLVRYYGWYSNVSRGKRKKAQEQGQAPGPEGIVEVPPPPCSRALKQRWAHYIGEVYEVDPLLCPRCKAPIGIIPPLLTRPQDTCIPWGLSLWEEHHPNGLTKGVCLVFCIGVTPRECGLHPRNRHSTEWRFVVLIYTRATRERVSERFDSPAEEVVSFAPRT